MAYSTRWKITFETIAGDVIEVLIQDNGWTGSVTQLQAANQPFTTEEDNDTDAFVPIRTQTGYINIITSDINLVRNIIPRNGTTRKVIAYKYINGDYQQEQPYTIFVGWVQPQLIDIDIWKGQQEVGIPVECYLSGLKNISFEQSGFVMFNEFLAGIFSEFNDFYFQCPALTNSDSSKADSFWLKNKFLADLFTDATQYDVLKAICVFFGWTCRLYGDAIYFIANRNLDDTYNRSLYLISLIGLKAISSNSPYAPLSRDWVQQHLTEAAIGNDDTRMLMNNGISQSIVKCNLTPYTESESPDDDALKQAIYNGTWNPQYVHTEVEEHGQYHVDEYYNAFSEMTVGNVKISGYNVFPQYHYQSGSPTGDLNDATLDIAVLQTTERIEEEVHDPEHYEESWREVVEVLAYHNGYMNMDTTEAFTFTTGTLRISFTRARYTYGSDYQQVKFRIKVGNYWYNPSTGEWQLQDPGGSITLSYGQQYSMTIGNLQGKVHLYIMCKSQFQSWSLTYEAEETETIDSSIREIVHMETTGMDFPVKKEIESEFGLKENLIAMSQNFVFDPSITPRTSLWTDTSMQYTFNPLVRLAEEVAEEMTNLGEILAIGIKHSVMPYMSPLTLMYIEWFDATYYPIAIDHDWRDDIDTVTFQRRRNASSAS